MWWKTTELRKMTQGKKESEKKHDVVRMNLKRRVSEGKKREGKKTNQRTVRNQ